jgi:asparagine synthase (glutamine-hydrolysing)
MCGITCSITNSNIGTSIQHLQHCFDKIKHRGPDSSQFIQIDENVIFGFHRLSINDLSSDGMQPLKLKNLVLIANAEIFNHLELKQLYNFNTHSKSDCEIILHLYDYFSGDLKKVCNNLRGSEYAFIIYDSNKKHLAFARDNFGIRPLFYTYNNNTYYFASELKSLPYFSSHSSYIFDYSHCLPGEFGHIDIIKNIFFKQFHYFFPVINNLHSLFCPEQIESIHKNINSLLKQAVKQRIMGERNIGAFLSGGIDSSLVCALLAKELPNIHFFSIGLSENGKDIIASKKVIEHLKISSERHHCVYFTIEDGYKVLNDVIYHLESFDVTTIRAGIPQYLLSKWISENTDIKVLFTGSGSDEYFNGYQYGKKIIDKDMLLKDSKRLLSELYLYDNLREDRVTSAFGLELRVPFLDQELVDYVLSIPSEYKLSNPMVTLMEKMLLRNSFKDENLIPYDILFRRKEAFSDAVSTDDKSWYKNLVDIYINPTITDHEFETCRKQFKHLTPQTKEELFYRLIFNEHFKKYEHIIPHLWLPPKYICENIIDPSATVLDCYES